MRGRLTVAVLAAALAVAGCAVEQPVSPLPIDAASSGAAPPVSPSAGPASVSPSASPPVTSPTSRRPASPRPSRTTIRPPTSTSTSSSCQGAIVYTIDLTTDELALVPSLCLAVGAVLRIENIGPGEVTTDAPPGLVDENYEAGIVEIRFLRAGTVVVTIPQEGTAYDITVVVR